MSSTIAVISFPGTNCEVESLRAIRRNGMEAISFKWNDDPLKLKDADGYFLPGGFSYEDRGRSGMIAAHDPLLDFLRGEAAIGKVIIGHCNGAQILVESGLIPLDRGLRMALAKNRMPNAEQHMSNFLNRWVWIKSTCAAHRCAVSDWNNTTSGEHCLPGVALAKTGRTMHVPIAHGEGRFTTRDKDLIKELEKNDQIAFRYCDEEGNVSEEYPITPNGSMDAIAGICNPTGNIIALMPHPERTQNGDRYFQSMRRWVEGKQCHPERSRRMALCHGSTTLTMTQAHHDMKTEEIFIDTVITNNEERSLEQLLRRYLPKIQLKQYRYCCSDHPKEFLSHIFNFNPNKEIAHIGRDSIDLGDVCLIRMDDGMSEGVCYVCKGVGEKELEKEEIKNIFFNPHASTLTRA